MTGLGWGTAGVFIGHGQLCFSPSHWGLIWRENSERKIETQARDGWGWWAQIAICRATQKRLRLRVETSFVGRLSLTTAGTRGGGCGPWGCDRKTKCVTASENEPLINRGAPLCCKPQPTNTKVVAGRARGFGPGFYQPTKKNKGGWVTLKSRTSAQWPPNERAGPGPNEMGLACRFRVSGNEWCRPNSTDREWCRIKLRGPDQDHGCQSRNRSPPSRRAGGTADPSNPTNAALPRRAGSLIGMPRALKRDGGPRLQATGITAPHPRITVNQHAAPRTISQPRSDLKKPDPTTRLRRRTDCPALQPCNIATPSRVCLLLAVAVTVTHPGERTRSFSPRGDLATTVAHHGRLLILHL